jgi:hypothetical protein
MAGMASTESEVRCVIPRTMAQGGRGDEVWRHDGGGAHHWCPWVLRVFQSI